LIFISLKNKKLFYQCYLSFEFELNFQKEIIFKFEFGICFRTNGQGPFGPTGPAGPTGPLGLG
jgi:hypothetical protein